MIPKIASSGVLFWFLHYVAFAQQTQPLTRFLNPPGMTVPKGYSQLVEIDLGTARMVLISGQVAMDATGNVVGKGDPTLQFEQIFRNLQTAVESVRGTMENIVKLTFFVRNVAYLPAAREARDKYINREQPPTSTAVEVSNLFRPEFLAEVEATVIIPKNKP
ncbi:RidA family protein [Spirosoma sp. KNUC1025]|uniref:RidA family protein n=1 Tax=Spirosoma sp. KNUC1025 TaxID=2894082 RepID=UPI00386C6811|nr:RidA family protein [Spirosoma sp. KNUC1025]